ncbi:CYTH domain-containing protein [Aeribacillus pallidus]|uniref:CYTH domain-containing protein n=1 Tax=Aeribacillus pallidus TaxID=33936 RepID=A0A223E5J3_9BACI|nr:CYTH domain-containing protein [Aeribacillus pallidus]ASS90538.1 CYTH domain-containing protein [Aeribacillus pallidus]
MVQELEIEFKNLLTKEEFHRLADFFQLTEKDFAEQENYYFDTKCFALKNHGAALRIRKKKEQYVLTLKEPYHVGLLETHQFLTDQEAVSAIHESVFPKEGSVVEKIKQLEIKPESLLCFGSLITSRATKKYKNGEIVLDHSRYENREDFEIEFEAEDETEGKQQFWEILNKHNIPIRQTENKIKRFYSAKFSKENL